MVRERKREELKDLNPDFGMIKGAGPIQNAVVIPFPRQTGGVLVWLGANGTGKTTAINCQSRLEGRKTPPITKNDLSSLEGYYKTPFGASLTIGTMVRIVQEKRNKNSKDFDPVRDVGLTINVLGDEFSIEDIVNPKEQTPASADGRTISAMVRLARKEADPELFMFIFESKEEFDEIVGVRAREATDLVDMAKLIKLDLEKKARETEEELDLTKREVLRLEGAVGNASLPEQPIDVAQKTKEHQAAVIRLDAVKKSKDATDKALKKLAELEKELSEMKPPRFNVDELLRERMEKASAIGQREEKVRSIREEIARLEAEVEGLESEIGTYQNEIEVLDANIESVDAQVKLHEKITRDIVEQKEVPTFTAEDVEKASNACDELLTAISEAAAINHKIEQFQALLTERAQARVLARKAESYRNAGRDAEGVLTTAIQELGTDISVEFDRDNNPRLMVYAEDRVKKIFFYDLSKGQKLAYTLPIAITAVGEGGVFTFPQESWEGLDGHNRAIVVRMCCEHCVIAVTGECDELGGDLRAIALTLENLEIVDDIEILPRLTEPRPRNLLDTEVNPEDQGDS